MVVVDFKMATEDQETKRLKLALMGRYNTIFVLPYMRVLTGKHIYNLYYIVWVSVQLALLLQTILIELELGPAEFQL